VLKSVREDLHRAPCGSMGFIGFNFTHMNALPLAYKSLKL